MTTYTWNVDADGDWSTASDWSPSGPPTSGASVIISTTDAHTITYSTGTLTIGGLSVASPDTFLVSGGALTLDSASFNALALSGGTLTFAASAFNAVHGLYRQTAGTLAVASGAELTFDGGGSSRADGFSVAAGGLLSFESAFTLTGGTYNIAGSTIIANGTVDFSAATIAGLGDLVMISGGTLELGAQNAQAATLSSLGGTVDGSGLLTVLGTSSLASQTHMGTGTTLLQGTTTITSIGSYALDLMNGRILENQGTVNWTASPSDPGTIYLGYDYLSTQMGDGTIRNDAGATFDIQTDDSISSEYPGSSFVNAGLVEKTVTTGYTNISALFVNTGTVSVQTGTLAFEGGGTSSASAFTVASGASVVFEFDPFTMTGGIYDAAGSTEIDGGRTDFSAAAITSFGGLLELDGGTLELGAQNASAGGYEGYSNYYGDDLDGSGTVTIAGSATLGGEFESGSGRTVFQGITTMENDDADPFGDALDLDGGRVLENAGTLTWVSGGSNPDNIELGYNPFGADAGGGTILNDANATFDIQTDSSITGSTGTNVFTNYGTLEKDTTTGTTRIEIGFTSTGTVAVQTGTLEFDGSATFSGAINGNGTIRFDGTTTFSGLVISGAIVVDTGGVIHETGAVTLGTAGNVETSFANAAGDTYDIDNNSGIGTAAASNFANFGLFDKTAGTGTSVIAVNFEDAGQVEIASGTLQFTGTDSFSGKVFGSGTLSIAGGTSDFTTGGTLLVSHLTESGAGTLLKLDRYLTYTGSLTQSAGSTLAMNNSIVLGGANSFAGAIIGTGQFDIEGGTDLVSAGTSVTVSSWSIAGGTATIAENLTYSGFFDISTGATVTINSGDTLTLDEANQIQGTVSGAGTLVLNSETQLFSGTILNVAKLSMSGGTVGVFLEANLAYAGALTQTSGTLAIGAHTLTLSGTDIFAGSLSGAGSSAGTLAETGGTDTFNAGATVSTGFWTITGSTTKLVLAESLSYAGAFNAGTGTTLTVDPGDSLTLGTSAFTGARFSGGGTIATTGAAGVAGLTLGGTVTLNNSGTMTLNGGSITVGDAGPYAAKLDNLAAGTIDITDNSGIALGAGSGSSFANAGLFEKTGGTGTSTVAVNLTDAGTVTVTAGTLAFGGTDNFTGVISGSGTLAFTGGSSTLGTGTTLTVAAVTESGGATKLTLGATLSYAGALTQTSGTIALGSTTLTLSGMDGFAGAISGAGTLAETGGTDTFNAGATVSTGFWTITGSTTKLVLAESLSYAGAFSAGTGTTLTIDPGDSFTLGTSAFTGARFSGGGTIATTGATGVAGLTLGGTVTLNNSGTMTVNGGSITVGDAGPYAAKLDNLAAGTIDITDNSGIALGAGSGSSFANAGLFEKTGGTGTSTVKPAATNSGTIAVTAGTLELAGTVSGTGGMTIGIAGTLKLDAAVAATQTVSFAGTTGGELILNDPSGSGLSFQGIIAGFGGSDAIDLATFGYSTTATRQWTQTTSGQGTLTVTDGTKTATLTLNGTYTTGNFMLGNDGNNFLLITDPPVAQAVHHADASAAAPTTIDPGHLTETPAPAAISLPTQAEIVAAFGAAEAPAGRLDFQTAGAAIGHPRWHPEMGWEIHGAHDFQL